MCGYLAYLKGEYPFLREAHSQPLQQTLRDLDAAYQNAFNPSMRSGLPRFKKREHSISIRFPQDFRIDGSGVYLPKIGWVGFRKSRQIEGRPKNVIVYSDGLHWYVAIQTEREIAQAVHPSESAVGIDLGVARFAALSDGSFVEGANALRVYEKRLTLLQRRMSRRKKFSANWRKAKAKVSRLHRKIANVRRDMLHKSSTAISKNHALVVLENLRIKNMTASASGTREKPGRNVRAKSRLNRRIIDQGWGDFRRQLQYKLMWNGGLLVLVDPRDTSRRCGGCGHICAQNRQTQSVFRCLQCGRAANADTNAAINILDRGLKTLEGQDDARIACGDLRLRESVKQEAQLVALARAEKSSVLSAGEHVNRLG